MMALGFLLIGFGFASNALVRTLPLLALTTMLFTLGEMIAMPGFIDRLSEAVLAKERT